VLAVAALMPVRSMPLPSGSTAIVPIGGNNRICWLPRSYTQTTPNRPSIERSRRDDARPYIIVSRDARLEARQRLLAKEKEFSHLRDPLSAER